MSATNAQKMKLTEDLKGRVAVITGASRGIGRECALALAKQGCHIVVAAKSTEDTPNLPGTIFSVAKEVEALGVQALPYKVDLRDGNAIEDCVNAAVAKFGRIDILINNASALWWHTIADTPARKYDLMQSINARGTFLMTQACLKHMVKGNWGRIVNMSPPIKTDYRAYQGFTAYNMAKLGMSMVAMGAAAEYADKGVRANCLWPATVIESQASENFKLGSKDMWRKATILSDAVVGLCGTAETNGQTLIDDEYLAKAFGFGAEELKVYRYNPDVEPPRALAEQANSGFGSRKSLEIGDVRKVKATAKL